MQHMQPDIGHTLLLCGLSRNDSYRVVHLEQMPFQNAHEYTLYVRLKGNSSVVVYNMRTDFVPKPSSYLAYTSYPRDAQLPIDPVTWLCDSNLLEYRKTSIDLNFYRLMELIALHTSGRYKEDTLVYFIKSGRPVIDLSVAENTESNHHMFTFGEVTSPNISFRFGTNLQSIIAIREIISKTKNKIDGWARMHIMHGRTNDITHVQVESIQPGFNCSLTVHGNLYKRVN
jgi:hypothetical protein